MTRTTDLKRAELLRFMASQRLGVVATASPTGRPEAALVGIAVTEALEVVFDTLDSTRKVPNLRANPRVAVVLGGMTPRDERTVQLEGVADEPKGRELGRLQEVYFRQFPDGPTRQSWPGIIYVRIRPEWIRYADHNRDPPLIVEYEGADLAPPR